MYCCPSPSFASSLSSLHDTGTTECWVTRSLDFFASFSPHFDTNIRLVCYCMWRTTSFQFQAPRKTNDSEWIFQRILQLFFELFSHNSSFPYASHTISLNIDMKMILSLKSAGSPCNSLIIFWISLRMPAVVNPGKISHLNSIGFLLIWFSSMK